MEDELIQNSRTSFVEGLLSRLDLCKRLLARYWWILLLALGLAGGVQWYLLKIAKPRFVSEGKMIVNVKVSIPEANVYSEEFDNFLGTQVALMQSERVRNRVEARLHGRQELHPSPVDLRVSLSPKSSIFSLQALGPDAEFTREYLRAAMDEYINLKKDLLFNASTATQLGLEEKLKEMDAELQKGKQQILNYQSSNRLIFLQPTGENNAAEYLATLTRQLDERKSELQLLKGLDLDQNLERMKRMAAMTPNPAAAPAGGHNSQSASRNAPGETFSDNPPPTLGDADVGYLAAKRDLRLLHAKRDALLKLKELAPDAPVKAELNAEIARKEFELESYREQSTEQLQNRQHVLEVQILVLEDEVKAKEKEALEASTKLATFNALQESQARLQARHDHMEGNLQTLDIDKGIGQQSVTILEDATPAAHLPPEKMKHMIMAELVGLSIGLALMMFLSRLDDRPTSFTELERIFDLPVLGQFPLLKGGNKNEAPILQLDDDRYRLIEASHSLRSALLYSGSLEQQPKSIVITSARPNDGKSMVSANFAITLAQTGARVLLVDADMRRGGLHNHFGVPIRPGLAEVLAGKCAWRGAVSQTGIPNLTLLPCGAAPRNPGNLFAKAGGFIAEIGEHYEYCLFDTSPVMVADDVLSLAPQVDGLLMVIRAGFTSGRIAQAALDLLRMRKVKVMGLVFNAVNPKGSDYYYYAHKEYDPLRHKELP
ncbi:MAG: polysaccharide biosynthesis tyrosine autokinase [Verrucomicrobiota bacterium]